MIKNQANTAWFQCEIDRRILKQLSRRTNWHGLLYLGFFVACVASSGWVAYSTIGTGWSIPAFLLYGSIWIFATSVVHEACHGTPFKNRTLNEIVLFVFGLMVQQTPRVLRYTHARHHSETAINGRDPEIVLRNPMNWFGLLVIQLFDVKSIYYYFRTVVSMSFGLPDKDVRACVPESEMAKAILEARAYLTIYLTIIAWSLVSLSWLPVVMLILPRVFGGPMHGLILATQHIGLGQDVRDHRYTTRTMHVNPILGLLYWNMNYHIEHHMFSYVPFHALPKLHNQIHAQCPQATSGVISALREMVQTVKSQHDDPNYSLHRDFKQVQET